MRLILASLTAFALTGCSATQGVRYVYQDGEFGVVGVPENTDRWPTRYRSQAEKLMEAHFPAGHEIVRAEEVVEGQRTLTVQGTNTAELSPSLPTELLKIGKIGLSGTRSQADTLKIKECRIIYKRAGSQAPPPDFSQVATLTPTSYIDPNADARKGDKEAKPAAEKAEAPQVADGAAKKPTGDG